MGRHRPPRPAPRRTRSTRLLAVGLLVGVVAALTATLIGTAPGASAATHPGGHLDGAAQRASGLISVRGWALDPLHPSASVRVDIVVDGHLVKRVLANATRGDVNRALHIHGRHGFVAAIAHQPRAKTISVYARAAVSGRPAALIAVAYLNGYRPPTASPGTRVVNEAKKYVGRSPYVDGGVTPRGFDCSGYTQYVYAHAGVPKLPRTAEQQRRAMRLVSAAHARPGDLVFYLSGGSAYHVAIYAGHGMQYAAATPHDGLRYQSVWSSAVQYRTNWH